jgi:site-specific recombinase XerD
MIKFEPFLDFYRDVKQVSSDTLKAYQSDLKHFGLFLETQEISRVAQIDHAVIARFITYMRNAVPGRGGRIGLADATIARRLAAISSFFDYSRATRDRKLSNPIDDFGNRWKRNNHPKPVDKDVIDQLLSAIDSQRDKVLIELYLATGLRLSEMAQLDRTTIVIEQHQDKGARVTFVIGVGEVVGKGNKVRKFYVSAKALLPLNRYLLERKDEHPALFLSERRKRMSQRAMQERLAHWCRVAGVPHTNIHRLRHTYATRLINAAIDIRQLMELMGHASIATTMQYAKLADRTVALGYHSAMEFVNS